jgi:hypothetical protein
MAIFYNSGNTKSSDFNPSLIWKMNPNSQWANHSYNHIALEHIVKASTNFNERQQARKELEIAEQKMKFWSRHPNFDESSALSYRKKYYRF